MIKDLVVKTVQLPLNKKKKVIKCNENFEESERS